MPANPKYLTQSPWQKFAKLSAGILGGYLISALLHMCIPILFHSKEVLIVSIFTLYIVWGLLLILPYLFKNGWKVWLLYLGVIILLYVVYHFSSQQNPFLS